MAFNFGAFAGGLSQGIQAGQKIALEQEQLEASRNKAAEAMKREEADAINRVAKNVGTHNKDISELTIKMNKAETEQEYNTYASELNSAIDSFSGLAQSEVKSGLLPKTASDIYNNARLQGVEPIETVSIKNYNNEEVSVSIPKSMAENKDSISLMENGKIGIAQMGDDGKIAGYQPTDISPTKFKVVEEKGTLAVIDGTEGFYTNEQLFNATKEGKAVEKSKDKPAVTKVEVKVDNVMAGDDSFRINKDTATVADAQGNYYVDGKGNPFLDDKGEKVYKSKTAQAATNVESKASYNQLMSRLNTMNSKIKENPNAIGSIGSNPISFLVNNAQDFINIPTEDNLTRGQLDGYASTMIATIRASSGENGVMTKDDADRIVKLIPSKNDSIDMFKQKVGILKDELVATAKIRDKAYGPNATSTEDKKTLPPLDINAFKIKQ